CQQHNEYPWAF
nr:immunoglobulin light chain junction region [Mus musculus]NSM02863.1 immunoglobulin light chain junction region [Mus musculus]NSM02865.1 immunoglobulin light chain junction region [Mus musculus]